MSENKYKVIPVSNILEEFNFSLNRDRKLDAEFLEEIINKVYAQYKVEGYKFHSVAGAGLLYVIFEKEESQIPYSSIYQAGKNYVIVNDNLKNQ